MAEYSPRPLKKWMRKICADEIALPDFQRGYVWEASLVESLFQSLLLGRPVGVLLVLGPSEKTNGYFKSRSFPNVEQEKRRLRELILDGQQRLTSIWQALSDDLPRANGVPLGTTLDKKYFIKVIKKSNTRFIFDKVTSKLQSDILSPREALEEDLVPVSILGFDGITQEKNALDRWCGEASSNVADRALDLRQAIADVTLPLRKSRLWFTRLGDDLSREECIDMFVTVNESNAKVSKFDIAVAEFSKPEKATATREQIGDWLSVASPHVLPFLTRRRDEDIRLYGERMLRIACLKANVTPTVGNYESPDVQQVFEDQFEEIGDGISYFFDLIFGDGVIRADLLPSEAPLQVVAALYSAAEVESQDRKGQVNAILRSYIWQAFLTPRYQLGTNERLIGDYRQLSDVLDKVRKEGKYYPFKLPDVAIPTIQDMCDLNGVLSGAGGRSRLLRAFLSMSITRAKDFATGTSYVGDQPRLQQRHHLFPRKFLQANLGGEEDIDVKRAINHVLNYALIEGLTNSTLGGKSPKEYLQDRREAQPQLTEDELRDRIESHVVPFDLLDVGNGNVRKKYELFIQARAENFAKIIGKLVGMDVYSEQTKKA